MAGRKTWRLAFLLPACAVIPLAFGSAASVARGQSGLRNHRPVHRLTPASPPPGYVPPTVACLRLRPTDSNVEYWVKATENAYALHTCPTELTFTKGPPGHQKEISDYRSCDWLQYVLPGGDGSTLITVWETGSAIMTRVFRLSPDHVTVLLERGTHLPPEFTLDGILINTGWVPIGERCCTASRTEIWMWTGKTYGLAATVSFGQRYEALARLEHEGKNK